MEEFPQIKVEECTPIKVEELIISDSVVAEEVGIDWSSGELTVSNALGEGSASVKQEPVTDISDEVETTAACYEIAVSSSSPTRMADQDSYEEEFPDDCNDELSSAQENKHTRVKKRQAKPKVCSTWSDEETAKLISCVKYLPVLWNVREKKYRNKIARQNAWKKISENAFDRKFNDSELMAKWANMRIQYRSYFTKYGKTKSGHGDNNPVKWKFYETMHFIGRDEEEQTETAVSNPMIADEVPLESPFDKSTTSTPRFSKSRRSSQSSSITTTSSAPIVAKEKKDDAAAKQVTEQQQRCEDEFDVFGRYIASELRSLSDLKFARQVRLKLTRCLMDCIETENHYQQ
ncbi:uncharacterized protein LOC129718289 isoform X3 [Wyeomyia smithii]|uniref:uncharacterized protein LOC129718289 isoform X3 n=1 Tax=Wyeomyia smithii TaxID=174621 RepID=UPI0024681CB6|nr:uncharacterized protein LOC129718289 isoform X3 [Wyeomyia smithii]